MMMPRANRFLPNVRVARERGAFCDAVARPQKFWDSQPFDADAIGIEAVPRPLGTGGTGFVLANTDGRGFR
jgi:hypothetical protein